MKSNKFLIICVLGLLSLPVTAQQEKKDIRDGNRHFKSEKYNESEVSYRKAVETEGNSVPGAFNLGDALYRQEKFEDAGEQFNKVINNNVDKNTKSQAFHNMGNSLLQAGQLDEAIEAYKNALRNTPNDMDTKYNLAYAQNLKKQEQEQQKQDQNQDQDQDQDQKDQDKKQDQKDQEKNEDQQKNKEQKDQEQKDQQDQQKQDQQQQDQQQQQAQEGKISKEDAQRLLEALANDEKKVQEKVKKAKAKAKRVRVLKDW